LLIVLVPAQANPIVAWRPSHASQIFPGITQDRLPCEDIPVLLTRAAQLRSHWKRDSLQQAITVLERARSCSSGIDSSREADSLTAIGEIYFILNDYSKSVDAYTRAVERRKTGSDRHAEVIALTDLARVSVYAGNNQQARDAAESALKISAAQSDNIGTAHALQVMGLALYFSGESRKALDYENQALLLVKETDEQELLAYIHLTLGYIHNDIDDLEEALSDYNQALAIWRSLHNKWGESKTLTSIGLVQTLVGDRQAALSSLTATLSILDEIGDRQLIGAALNNIAYVYQTLGEFDLALQYFQRALNIYKDIKFQLGEALTLQYCGDVQALKGDLKSALSYYELAIPLSRTVKNVLLEADGLNSLGSFYFMLGDRKKARELFEQSLSVFSQENHWRGQSSALSNIGYYFESEGDVARAHDSYIQALSFARSARDTDGAASILYNLARVELRMGELSASREHIEESLRLHEISRAKVGNQELRVSYFATVHQHYEFYIDLLMQLHKQQPAAGFDVKALQASERARARSLLELLSQTGSTLGKTIDPELVRRERALRDAMNEELLRDSGRSLTSAPKDKDAAKVEQQYQEVKAQLRATSPGYASIVLPEELNLSEVQSKLLDVNTAILEYSLGEKKSFLWLVTSDGARSYELPPRAEIEKSATDLSRLLARSGGGPVQDRKRSDPVEDYWRQAASFSNMVLPGDLSKTKAKRLVIIADGVLQNIPFSALTSPDSPSSAQPRALLDDYELINLPSIAVLSVIRKETKDRHSESLSVAIIADPVFESTDPRVKHNKAKPPSNKRFVTSDGNSAKDDLVSAKSSRFLHSSGFEKGIPRLPFSRQEAQSILALSVTGDSFAALDFKANYSTVMSGVLSKYRYLHFATHGIVNSAHPELSGILLSMVDERGRPQQGFLQLSDIYSLTLSADLVVLSACQTGLGKDMEGEGIIGLTRGFFYAGASRVVSSFWNIDDAATAELMRKFYEGILIQKLAPAAALRSAQLETRKQRRYRSPYYWAGFTVQGKWN
jgi:CHAT domain-containing protein/Tfp pilus assembly protein PilF